MFVLFWISGFALNLKENNKNLEGFNIIERLNYSTIYSRILEQNIEEFDHFDPLFQILPISKDKIRDVIQKLKIFFDLLDDVYPAPQASDPFFKDYTYYSGLMDHYYDGAKKFVANQGTLTFLPERYITYFGYIQKLYDHFSDSIYDFIYIVLRNLKVSDQLIAVIVKNLPSLLPLLCEDSFAEIYSLYHIFHEQHQLVLSLGIDHPNEFVKYITDTYLDPLLKELNGKVIYSSISAQLEELKQYTEDLTDLTIGQILQHFNVMNRSDYDLFINEVMKILPNIDALKKVNVKSVVGKIPVYDAVTIIQSLAQLDPNTTTFGDIENAMMIDITPTTTKKKKTTIIIIPIVCGVVGVAIIVVVVILIWKKKNSGSQLLNRTSLVSTGNVNLTV